MSDNVFRGGVPYNIDVKRLTETFPIPSLTEGRVINHAELEEVVRAARGSQRYYSVTNFWIRQMKAANGIFIAWKPGVGVEVLDPAGTLTYAETKTRQKFRQTEKAIGIFSYIDRARLNPLGQQRFDHDQRVLGVYKDATRVAKKDLAVALGPIQSLPKRKLIQEA